MPSVFRATFTYCFTGISRTFFALCKQYRPNISVEIFPSCINFCFTFWEFAFKISVVPHPFPSSFSLVSARKPGIFSIKHYFFASNHNNFAGAAAWCPHSGDGLLDWAFAGAGSANSHRWSFYTQKYISDLTSITALPEHRQQSGQTAFPSLLLWSFNFFLVLYIVFSSLPEVTFALKYSKHLYLRSFLIPMITRVHITACMAYGSAYHVNNKVWIMQFLVVIIFYYYPGSFLGSLFFHLMWNFGLPY